MFSSGTLQFSLMNSALIDELFQERNCVYCEIRYYRLACGARSCLARLSAAASLGLEVVSQVPADGSPAPVCASAASKRWFETIGAIFTS